MTFWCYTSEGITFWERLRDTQTFWQISLLWTSGTFCPSTVYLQRSLKVTGWKNCQFLLFCHLLKICYCFYSCFVCDNSTDSQFWKWSHSLSTASNNIDIWTKYPFKQKLQYELVSSLAVLTLLEFDLVKRSKARNLCILSFQQWVEMALNFSLSKQVNICC